MAGLLAMQAMGIAIMLGLTVALVVEFVSSVFGE